MIPLLIIISMLSFGIIRMAEVLADANPIAALKMNPSVTQATIQREIERLGLNDPLHVRYWKWASNFVQGDMGESYFYKSPVSGLITERITNTLVMGIASFLVTWLIAIPLGIYLAVKQYSLIDQFFSSLSYFFQGFPDFFLAILFLLLAAKTGLFPISGMTSVNNNHMAKIQTVYDGKYERNPKAFAKLSPDFQKYVTESKEKADKQDILNKVKNILELDLAYGKSPYISDSVKTLTTNMALVQKIDPELPAKIDADIKAKNMVSRVIAMQISDSIKKMKDEEKAPFVALKDSLDIDIKNGRNEYIEDSVKGLLENVNTLKEFPSDLASKLDKDMKEKGEVSKELGSQALSALKKITYFTWFEKFTYTMKNLDRILYHYSKYIPDVLYHLILPTITLSIISIAGLQRRMRANLLDVLNEDYIRTARAKGLPENIVIYKHAVRNALNPMVTLLGFEFAGLLSGAAFIEILFSWPGLGQMMLEALTGNDLSLVMAGLVLSCIMLLIGNLISDLLLAVIDPRIKLED